MKEKDTYIVVTFPESTAVMEQSWFEECEIMFTDFGRNKYGDATLLVPKQRYDEMLLNINQVKIIT